MELPNSHSLCENGFVMVVSCVYSLFLIATYLPDVGGELPNISILLYENGFLMVVSYTEKLKLKYHPIDGSLLHKS